MARIRTIKPEFFSSFDIASVSPLARLFFEYLWTEADREGLLEWKPNNFRMRFFPTDTYDIDELASELINQGLIDLHDDEQICVVKTFKDHQVINNREADSKLLSRVPHASARVKVACTRVKVACTREKAEGKGKEGKGKEGNSNTASGDALYKSLDISGLPESVPINAVKEFIDHRRAIKKPLTQGALDRAVTTALGAGEIGLTPEQALTLTIDNGWQAVNLEWLKSRLPEKPKATAKIKSIFDGAI